jgi:PhnB protein
MRLVLRRAGYLGSLGGIKSEPAVVNQDDCVAPPGWHSVTPRLVAENAHGLLDFVCHVFAAVGAYQSTAPSVVQIGDSKLMISEAGERSPSPAFLYVYVTDVVGTYLRAVERGANSIEAPFDTPYGDRRCMVQDKWGNTWQIATQLRGDNAA